MAKKLPNKLKAKAWKAFSKYIRVRDCIKTTGLPYVGVCITCDKRHHINYLDAGHCYPGRRNANLFNERFTNIQCRYCNQYCHGKPKKYEKVMIEWYGAEYVARQKIRLMA